MLVFAFQVTNDKGTPTDFPFENLQVPNSEINTLKEQEQSSGTGKAANRKKHIAFILIYPTSVFSDSIYLKNIKDPLPGFMIRNKFMYVHSLVKSF